MKDIVVQKLAQRGVYLQEIARIVLELQRPFDRNLELSTCLYSVEMVITKREVQHLILTGLALDMLTEEGQLEEPLQGIIARDEGLYGVDETLAMGIATIYGTIGITSFGYLDKEKKGIMKKLDNKGSGQVNTFLDDIVAGIASAAAARIAHTQEQVQEEEIS